MDDKLNLKTKKIKLFFLFAGFSLVLSLTHALIEKIYFENNIKQTIYNNGLSELEEKQTFLKEFLNRCEQSLKYIRDDQIFVNYLNSPSEKNDVENFFLNYAKHNADIMQLRYLNSDGLEKIRIDRSNKDSNPIIFKSDMLQDKSHRYYFKDSLNKKREEVLFSAIDLNIENKKLDIPFKPTFRAVLPIDFKGKFAGILIINYFMDDFLYKLSFSSIYDLIIADQKGYILIHHDKEKNWGFYKKEKFNISKEFPVFYKEILSNDMYKTENLISKKLSLNLKEDLILILKIKSGYINSQQTLLGYKFIAITAIIILFSLILSILVSKYLAKTILNLNEMKKLNKKYIKQTKELNKLKNNLEMEVQKQLEINLAQQVSLFEQSKFASLGGMIGNIAHQWKQPLTIISTVISSLQFKYQMDLDINKEEIIKDTQDILDKVDYLNENINTFRNFLKEKKEYKKINIKDEIKKALNICSVMLKDNKIELIDRTQDAKDIYVELVNGELSEVIINLINNAKDALKERFIENPYIKISIKEEKDKIFIQIQDNANGIDEVILPKIFDQYFTTKTTENGTGLGLYMSKTIIEKSLKGKIYAKNEENGAVFIIEFKNTRP